MGGEFYLAKREDNNINPKCWKRALSNVIEKLRMDLYESNCSKVEFNQFGTSPYAIEFTDDHYPSKTFKLKWVWGENAIDQHLNGRKRGDWSMVRTICELLVDHFPGDLALVVCDGFSGYNDDMDIIYYDGIKHSSNRLGYKQGSYQSWPWTSG
jgi:hypothetical protein